MTGAPLTTAADPARDMPAHAQDRLDVARRAVDTLDREAQRLARLGLETPLARCRVQRRFWSFVGALCAIADRPTAPFERGTPAWRPDPTR